MYLLIFHKLTPVIKQSNGAYTFLLLVASKYDVNDSFPKT